MIFLGRKLQTSISLLYNTTILYDTPISPEKSLDVVVNTKRSHS